MFIDHFEHFPETEAFVERWADEWALDLVVARNADLARLGSNRARSSRLGTLRTGRGLRRVDHDEDTCTLDADSYAGNHLLKTVAFNDAVEEHGFDGLCSGVRWDEQEARTDEASILRTAVEDGKPSFADATVLARC